MPEHDRTPEQPESIPPSLREELERQSAKTLRDVAEYARSLADSKAEPTENHQSGPAGSEDTPEDWDDENWAEKLQDARSKAQLPSGKGTLTTKEIDGREYYYLQWREGDSVKSQYVAPVEPAE